MVLWALRPEWDEGRNILARTVSLGALHRPGSSGRCLGRACVTSAGLCRAVWPVCHGQGGFPYRNHRHLPWGALPSLSRTVCMTGSARVIGSAGSIACSGLNGFELVDLIRALLLYARAHPGAGGASQCALGCVCGGLGFTWSARDGNVNWFNARKFSLFFQDPKAG